MGRYVNAGSPVNLNSQINQGLLTWYKILSTSNMYGGGALSELVGINRRYTTYQGNLLASSHPSWSPGPSPLRGLLNFTAIGNQVNCGQYQSLTGGLGSLTVSFWYLPRSPTTFTSVIFQSGGGNFGFQIGPTATELRWAFSTSINTTSPSGAFTNNALSHVVWVFNGGGAANANRVQLYVNGTAKTLTFTGTIPSTTPVTSVNMTIGKSGVGNSAAFGIDSLRFYNQSLTANQAAQLYQEEWQGCPNTLNWIKQPVFGRSASTAFAGEEDGILYSHRTLW
jgi:hypothetical protein